MERLRREARAERRAMVALVALFALLIQAFAPAFAAAGPMPEGAATICDGMGLAAAPDDPTPPPVDHACKHCLCPAPAGLPPMAPVTARVAYASTPAPVAETPRGLVPQARAPPRPPGQGPPTPNA